jgi:hypothetical protein
MAAKSDILNVVDQYMIDMAADKIYIGLGSIFVSDNGLEYVSTNMSELYQEGQISLKTIPPHTPEFLPVERSHQTVQNMQNCMLYAAGMGTGFWPLARQYTCYVLARLPNSALNGEMPFNILYPNKTIDRSLIRTFGSPAFVHIPTQLRTKQVPKAWRGRFVGIGHRTSQPLVYNPVTNNIVSSYHVVICDTVLMPPALDARDFHVMGTDDGPAVYRP